MQSELIRVARHQSGVRQIGRIDGRFGALHYRAEKRDNVLRCVYGQHSKRDLQYPPQAGDEETAGEARQGIRPKLQLSHFRCCGIIRRQSGNNVGRDPPGRPTSESWALRQTRRYEGLAAVLGYYRRDTAAEVRLRQGARLGLGRSKSFGPRGHERGSTRFALTLPGISRRRRND